MNDTMMAIGRGSLGIFCMLLVAYAVSDNRKAINWRLVVSGVLLQAAVAIAVLKIGFVRAGFEHVSVFFLQLMEFTREGSGFLFGPLIADTKSFGFIFAFQVLPTIVFFSAFTSLLYYLNILQVIVYAFAWVMTRTMKLSGAESLAAAANIFLGQTEAPLVVKPYLEKMTRSEILALMVPGMASIAGSVLVAYVSMLGGGDEAQQVYFATHLMVASIMSAPAALLIAKMLVPETEPVNQELLIPRERAGTNLLDAITIGTTEGVKLAVNVAAMLLVFVAMIAMVNYIVGHWIGPIGGLNARVAAWSGGRYEGLSLQCVLGVLMAPVAWVMGVPGHDLLAVGQLLGEKTILNEFYAYATLAKMKESGLLTDPRAVIIATYALCGFANFSSIGIQVGGISALAPGQRTTLAALGMRALIGGTLASFMTACIAGMLV